MNFKKFHESKNLFDKDNTTIYNAYFDNGGQWILSDDSKSIKIPCQPNTEYTISVPNSLAVFRVYESDNASITPAPSSSAGIPRATEIIRGANISQYTFTTSSTAQIILFQGSGSVVTEWFNGLMLNTGSTPQPYEPYSSEVWHDTPYYQHKTATDTLTTLPAVIYPNDTSITVGIKGQSSQSGTPSPQNPVPVNGTGEMSSNLLATLTENYAIDASGNINSNSEFMYYTAPCEANETYTFSLDIGLSGNNVRIHAFNGDTWMEQLVGKNIVLAPFTVSTPANTTNLKISIAKAAKTYHTMLNVGETALPYEPFGYKIPISSANTTTPVYLGEVETTRLVKKLVLTGEEAFIKNDSQSNHYLYYANRETILPSSIVRTPVLCNELPTKDGAPQTVIGINTDNQFSVLYFNFGADIMNAQPSGNTVEGLKEYLAAKYANGTPVTVWYVLATPQTAVVNEPLMKIGSYSDSLTTSVSCTAGSNSFDVDTTVQPSEVTATFEGWHPVSAAHEHENGQWD